LEGDVYWRVHLTCVFDEVLLFVLIEGMASFYSKSSESGGVDEDLPCVCDGRLKSWVVTERAGGLLLGDQVAIATVNVTVVVGMVESLVAELVDQRKQKCQICQCELCQKQ
jgi:hypothetical protein